MYNPLDTVNITRYHAAYITSGLDRERNIGVEKINLFSSTVESLETAATLHTIQLRFYTSKWSMTRVRRFFYVVFNSRLFNSILL
jgi:hypothetical protein